MMETAIESKWLRSAIRHSLSAKSYTSSLDGPGPPEQNDPRFRKLVEGIYYSRKLILTYHLAIFGLLLFAAGLHWFERSRTWRRGPTSQLQQLRDDAACDRDAAIKALQNGAEIEGGSSSGSSTLEGTEDLGLQFKNVDEATPLFHDGHTLRPVHPRRSLIRSIQAFLIYQPRPIPLVNKALPSNAYTIIIVGFIALNIFYTFFHINFTVLELFVFADRCGLVFAANLPLLYLLAAKTQPLRFLTGHSYESLNIIHRRLGELLCLEALLHSVGMVMTWYTLLRPIGFTLTRFLLNKVIILGIACFISYETLYFTSLASFRQRWYELFLGLHVFLQATGLALLFFHHPNSRVYVGVALGIVLTDRLIYRIGIKSTHFPATAEIMEDGETVRISANVTLEPCNTLHRLLGRNISQGWQSADHVFVSVPSLGRGHVLQAHPFTIMSPAPQANDRDARLDLLIRAQEGFSADVLREAMERSSLAIRIDGPYGSHHARALLQACDLALLVAGGSGIAVAWPLVHFLLIQNPPRKIILVWVVHRESHVSWVGWPALREAGSTGVRVLVPTATEVAGRPDLNALLRRLVIEDGTGKRTAVVGSGPDSMGRSVRNACAEMVQAGWSIGVAIEKFGW